MKRIAPLLLVALLAACDPIDPPPPNVTLPPLPADLARCFNVAVGNVPDRDLSIAEVERLWKSDRVRAVVMQRCGKRLIAWYGDIRKKWK